MVAMQSPRTADVRTLAGKLSASQMMGVLAQSPARGPIRRQGAGRVARGWLLVLLAMLLCALALPRGAAAQQPNAADEPTPAENGEDMPPWSRLRGEVAISTPHFDVRVPPNSPLAAQAGPVAAVLEKVLPTVEARMETSLDGRVSVVVLPADQAPEPCAPRAAAFPSRRRIVLFAGPNTLEPRALDAFLAHELGHQLNADRWGQLGGDRRLLEGLATWAAEPYWLAWQGWGSLDGGVNALLAAGAFAPLAMPPEGCLAAAQRDVYYSAWASFVDFLIRRYGWERLRAAMTLPLVSEDRADYESAYGRSLEDLAAEWQRTLTPSSLFPSETVTLR